MAEKWKPEIKSPGDAWMEHANREFNAKAFTPAYLDPDNEALQKTDALVAIEKRMKEIEKENNLAKSPKAMEKKIAKEIKMPR